jgi:competence protein ComEC
LLAIPAFFAMLMGFLVMLLGWLVPPLAFLLAGICDFSLMMMEGIVSIAAGLRGVSWYLPDLPMWWVIGFYALLAIWVALGERRPPWRWTAAIASAWVAAGILPGLIAPYFEREDRPLAATFLAVGHGTCVLLELPDGRTMLYDCGQLGFPQRGSRMVSAALWQRGITHVDAVVLSHADLDHYNALPGLLERVSVGVVYVSPVMFEKPGAALRELETRLKRTGMPVRLLRSGDRLAAGKGTTIEVLHPPRKGVIGSDNANSIVLSIATAGRRLLLPGDLESPGLDDLLAEEPLDCDILMAPHHGSIRSNPRGFAAWSQPELVVVSGSRGQDAQAVRDAYQEAGAEVCHTAYDGAIRMEVSSAGITVRRWRRERW